MTRSSETPKFKMKRRPVKPKKHNSTQRFIFVTDNGAGRSDGVLVSTILSRLTRAGVNPEDCYLVATWNTIRAYAKESKADYQKRLEAYNRRVQEYEQWLVDHATEIYEIEEAKRQAKINKHLESRSRKKRRLKDKLEKIQQDLIELDQKEISV